MNDMIQPDIEIYVKNLEFEQLEAWLKKHFVPASVSELSETQTRLPKFQASTISLSYEGKAVELSVTPNAAGKVYTSLWFKQNHTPWQDDKSCALDFLADYDAEVRCSAAGWVEEEPEESEQWWRLTRTHQTLVRWG